MAPAGLTVVEERTAYIRDLTCMTTLHEVGHLLDLALGGGAYWSGYSREFRAAYAKTREFMNPYSASGLDEAFAESARAMVSPPGADAAPNLPASRERLRAKSPELYAVVSRIFDVGESLQTTTAA